MYNAVECLIWVLFGLFSIGFIFLCIVLSGQDEEFVEIDPDDEDIDNERFE